MGKRKNSRKHSSWKTRIGFTRVQCIFFFFLFWAQTIAMHFSSKSALERKTNYVYSLLLPYSYHLDFHSFINCLNHSSTRNHYEPKNHTVHNIVVSTSRSDQIIMYNSCNCVHGVLYVDATQMNGIFNSIMLSCYLWEKWSSIYMIAMHSFFFLYWRNLNNCDDKPILLSIVVSHSEDMLSERTMNNIYIIYMWIWLRHVNLPISCLIHHHKHRQFAVVSCPMNERG